MFSLRAAMMFTVMLCVASLTAIGQSGQVSIIVYSEFLSPRSAYDSIYLHLKGSGFASEIKITGMPLFTNGFEVRLDSAHMNTYQVSIASVKTLKDSIEKTENLQWSAIQDMNVVNANGDLIPFSAFAEVYAVMKPYRPHIYLPEPSAFESYGRNAVKIEVSCGKDCGRLTVIADRYLSSFFEPYGDGRKIDYQIDR